MKVEGGLDGPYMNMVARRAARGSGQEGFLNVIALRREISKIVSRQALRIAREQEQNGTPPDPFYLTKEDLFGPDPSAAVEHREAWLKLHRMVGLSSVKESVRQLLKLVQLNYQRELRGEPIRQVALNRVFLGSPGTGKTTVARLYARILADLGLLSKGEVILRDPTDFIGIYLGQSEAKTRDILRSAVGSVLGPAARNARSLPVVVYDALVGERSRCGDHWRRRLPDSPARLQRPE
ncbi:hypothetical protein VTN96DRAFT_4611 [Rasamsonia emersonii]